MYITFEMPFVNTHCVKLNVPVHLSTHARTPRLDHNIFRFTSSHFICLQNAFINFNNIKFWHIWWSKVWQVFCVIECKKYWTTNINMLAKQTWFRTRVKRSGNYGAAQGKSYSTIAHNKDRSIHGRIIGNSHNRHIKTCTALSVAK